MKQVEGVNEAKAAKGIYLDRLHCVHGCCCRSMTVAVALNSQEAEVYSQVMFL